MVTTDGRPPILSPRFDMMPEQLRAIPAWVVWRAEFQPDKGKYSKIPIDAKWGDRDRPGSSTNVATWADFETARRCYERHRGHFAGVGFVLSESDPFAGIDLDNVIGPDRTITEAAQATIAAMATYTEVSPSGKGVRMFVAANLPPSGRKKGDVEMYESGRFLTVTGRRIPGSPSMVVYRQEAVEALHASVFPPMPKREQGAGGGTGMLNAADCDIIAVAVSNPKNGVKIGGLLGGSMAGYPSHSEADSALAWHLAYYTGPNPATLDRLMRSSGLMRDKWDERHFADGSTYGESVVRRAIESCQRFYEPRAERPQGQARRPSRPGEFDQYRERFLQERGEQ